MGGSRSRARQGVRTRRRQRVDDAVSTRHVVGDRLEPEDDPVTQHPVGQRLDVVGDDVVAAGEEGPGPGAW